MTYGSVIKSSGDKIDNNTKLPVWVQGAYNLGPIIENKEIETAAIHPGEGVDNATGAGGEDNIVLMLDKSLNPLGVAEIDFGMVLLTTTDYEVADDIPVIIFHYNPGALLRNVQSVDPASNIEPNQGITSSSGTAGSFADWVEADVVVEDGSKFCFGNTAAGTNGASGTFLSNRIYLRAAKYHTDAGAAMTLVAYISK